MVTLESTKEITVATVPTLPTKPELALDLWLVGVNDDDVIRLHKIVGALHKLSRGQINMRH